MRIDDDEPSTLDGHRYPDADPARQLRLDPEVRRQAHRFALLQEGSSGLGRRRRSDQRLRDFGGSTVNSITLFYPHEGSGDVTDGPVAVISYVWSILGACFLMQRLMIDRNNDKTVRVFSPAQNRLLATLEFPFAMNHASIRPDGKILVAVGDAAYGMTYIIRCCWRA